MKTLGFIKIFKAAIFQTAAEVCIITCNLDGAEQWIKFILKSRRLFDIKITTFDVLNHEEVKIYLHYKHVIY